MYSGRVGGSHYYFTGGAADYLCLPDDPEYSDFTPGYGGNQDRQVYSLILSHNPCAFTMKICIIIGTPVWGRI